MHGAESSFCLLTRPPQRMPKPRTAAPSRMVRRLRKRHRKRCRWQRRSTWCMRQLGIWYQCHRTTAYAHWCYVVGHVLCRCILSAGLPGMSFLPHASSPEPPAPVQGWYLASPEGVTIATHSTNTRAFSGPKSGEETQSLQLSGLPFSGCPLLPAACNQSLLEPRVGRPPPRLEPVVLPFDQHLSHDSSSIQARYQKLDTGKPGNLTSGAVSRNRRPPVQLIVSRPHVPSLFARLLFIGLASILPFPSQAHATGAKRAFNRAVQRARAHPQQGTFYRGRWCKLTHLAPQPGSSPQTSHKPRLHGAAASTATRLHVLSYNAATTPGASPEKPIRNFCNGYNSSRPRISRPSCMCRKRTGPPAKNLPHQAGS